MNLRSPAVAIAWQIWTRNRVAIYLVALTLVAGSLLLAVLGSSSGWSSFTSSAAYALTAVALLLTLGCFHFTEGSKKGGFGTFPMRLFNLPVKTRSLVALPMIYGAAGMALVYLLSAGLLLRYVGSRPPLLWPCLYLVFGLTQFQMIVWSLPESRYLKLLCLSVAASIITFGWMFFVPTIVEGALSEWGFGIDPTVFMRRLLLALALTGPVAYGVSLYRVRQQRHGLTARSIRLSAWWDRSFGKLWRRRAPFRSADHAILWQEWRRTGFILPVAVLVVMALTCVPAWLSGGLSGQATMGILNWLFIAPILFALIVGRGFSKPDFWSTSLKIAPFQAIRPVSAGQWVVVRLKVAFGSAVLTWALVVYFGFVWTAWVGDLGELREWLMRIRFYYSSTERWLMLILAGPVMVMIIWRFLVASLAVGLSGNQLRYYAVNLLVGIGMVMLFILTIWRADNDDHSLHLYNLWPLIEWLPLLLTALLIVKLTFAALTWNHVLLREMISVRSAAVYLAGWLIGTGLLMTFVFILCRNTLWLRHLLMLLSILAIPLAGPALAMRAFAKNRSSS